MPTHLLRWVGLALGTFALGTVGFQTAMPERSLLSAMFSAIQLFALNSGDVDGTVPWPLELARWMAVVLSGSAVFAIAKSVATEAVLGLRLSIERLLPWDLPFGLFPRRAIVIGLGRKGMSLIEDLRAQREPTVRVLGIDRDPERVELARKRGIDALVGDATAEAVLRRLPWRRTPWAVLVMGGDAPNVTAALSLVRLRGDADIRIAVHVPNLELRDLMLRQDALKADGVRLFNYYERLARRTLIAYPVEAIGLGGAEVTVDPVLGRQGVKTGGDPVPHIFIRPCRDFTPALVALLARSAHFPHLTPRPWTCIKVILVGEDAETQRVALQRLYPALRRQGQFALIDLEALQPGAGESPAQAIAAAVKVLPSGTPTTVFLDIHDAGAALIESLGILDGLGVPAGDERPREGIELRCVFDFAEEPAIVTFADAHPTLGRYLLPLPSMADCCGRKVLFDAEDQMDALARTIHANYSEATPPAQRQSWESLTLELQDSNRAAADHIGVVMRQLLASGRDPRRPDFRWEPEVLEALAECEHRRWAAQKLMAGWTPDPALGEAADKLLKRHGCLDRRYEELSPAMQERDRDNVRIIPMLLARVSI